MSDGESRQYIREAWQPYTLNCENGEILCNLNPEPGTNGDATLCLIPTQAKNVVADPASLKEKPNVMSQWLDRLTSAGAGILLMHGEHYDDLQLLADSGRARGGRFCAHGGANQGRHRRCTGQEVHPSWQGSGYGQFKARIRNPALNGFECRRVGCRRSSARDPLAAHVGVHGNGRQRNRQAQQPLSSYRTISPTPALHPDGVLRPEGWAKVDYLADGLPTRGLRWGRGLEQTHA